MEYVQMTLDDWLLLKKEILGELARTSASFVRIGYLLRQAEDNEGYKNDGYDSLAEWAGAELGLSPSYVSRFKKINARYSVGGYSDRLRPEYVGYGSAKLGEMLALPDADMEMVTPETKRDDIRALNRFNKEKPVAESETWLREMMEVTPDAVKVDLLKAYAAEGHITGKKCEQILNPAGSRLVRTKAAVIALTEDGVIVKIFSPEADRKRLTWQELADRLEEMIGSGELSAGRETAEAAQERAESPEKAHEAEGATNTGSEAGGAEKAPEKAKASGNTQEAEEIPEQIPKEENEETQAGEETAEDGNNGESSEENSDAAEGIEAAEAEGVEAAESFDEEGEGPEDEIAPAQKESGRSGISDFSEVPPVVQKEDSQIRDIEKMIRALDKALKRSDWDWMLNLIHGIEAAVKAKRRDGA